MQMFKKSLLVTAILIAIFCSQSVADEILYCGTTNPGKVCAYSSGTTWQDISPTLGFSVTCLSDFQGNMYAGVNTNSYTYSSQGLVLRYDGYDSDSDQHIWTQVGQLDNQICFLIEYDGYLHAGTSHGSAKIYRYDPFDDSWTLVVNYTSGWTGARSARVLDGWLYFGDWTWDQFARWNGSTLEDLGPGGGSCIYSLERYGDYIYGGAYMGAMYRITHATGLVERIWNIPNYRYIWALHSFQDRMYIGADYSGSGSMEGQLWRHNYHTDTQDMAWSLPVSNNHEGVISLTSEGDNVLYIGVGGQAVGYPPSLSGAGMGQVWAYDGSNITKISTDGMLGTGVQTLHFGNIGCRIIVETGPDLTVECDNLPVTLQATAVDNCDNDPDLLYVWYDNDIEISSGLTSELTYDFDPGFHYVTIEVSNNYGAIGKDAVIINIVDTVPPELTCPPNITIAALDTAEVCISGTDWPGDYSWEEILYEWEPDIGTPLDQSDDDYDYVSLGFDFDFYGTMYSGIYIGSNGLIKFNVGSGDYSNSCLPSSESAAQYMLAPLWDDLNPASGGDVYHRFISIVGSSPARKIVVTWQDVPHYPDYGNNTFQVILYEETGKIQYNYSELWDGNTPTVGVQLNTTYFTSINCGSNPNYPSSILLSPPCSEFGLVEVAINPDIGTATAEDNCAPSVIITNNAPHIFMLGETIVTWTATDWESNQSTCTQIVTVVPPFGSVCASVNISGDTPSPAQGVLVTVIDLNGDPVADPVRTNELGEAFFDSILVGEDYSVMIVTPLGYSVLPSETQNNIVVVGNECTPVEFSLTPIIISNDCRTIGYWKHQFNVYTSNRGNAQESSADLDIYLGLVHLHFDILGVYFGLDNYDFEDAKNVLTVKGGRLMEDRAKQQLFALLLNFASGRIGNETVVSDDGRVAAEAVTHAADLINDGNPDNDELAKTICDLINNGKMVEAGIIPESPMRYRLVPDEILPESFSLNQNYPNPFNAQTTISFTRPEACNVRLTVFNILGQVVEVLVDDYMDAGSKSVIWNAGSSSSGMYFFKLNTDSYSDLKKMTLLK